MAGNGARPAWRRAALTASVLVALASATIGPLIGRSPGGWPWFAFAVCAAILAHFAALTFRQSERLVLFAWGEAGLVIVVYLVPMEWAPLVIGVGWLVGHALYLLRTGGTWTRRRFLNVANITTAGAAGAFVAR